MDKIKEYAEALKGAFAGLRVAYADVSPAAEVNA
jgi:hypothetical protein